MEDDREGISKQDTGDDAGTTKDTSGYRKLPQEDKEEAPVQETKDTSEPPNMDIEENQPPEKTTTRYTKLPPMEEDKETAEKVTTETTKPEQIAEEEEPVDEPEEKIEGEGGEQVASEE